MKLIGILLASTGLIGFLAVPAVAQDASTSPRDAASPVIGDRGAGLDSRMSAPVEPQAAAGDIIVTANRMSSLASKTPIALTAITGDNLIRSGVTSTAGLADHVPNLQLSTNNGGLQITIRGITNEEPTERGDPSAAFLINDVYIARPQAIDVAMYDVNRIEVLRGPQGTLFGRNTTAGLINVVTNRPKFTFGGSGDIVIGNYGTVLATGVVNVPVSNAFAVRAAVNFDMRDNYMRPGPLLTGNYDKARKNFSGRLSALYEWDTGSVLVRGDYSDINGRPYDLLPLSNFFTTTTTGVNPNFIAGSTKDQLTVNAPLTWDGFRRNSTWGIGGEISQSLGPIRLIYVGSYREFNRDEADPRISANGSLAYRLEWDGKFRQQSHELRLATEGDGPLKLQVGAMYFREKVTQDFRLLLVPNTFLVGSTNRTGNDPLVNTNYGFFGQGTYSLAESLRITLGARYSHDEKKSDTGFTELCSNFNCDGTITRTSNNIADAKSSKVTWRIGVDYDLTPSTLLYATVSTGYKAGGFNTGCEIGTQPGCALAAGVLYYQPETVTSYEAGVKARLFDEKLRVNLNAFTYDYSNIQLNQVVADCGGGASCSVTTNAGKAKVTGVELEGTFSATPDDRFEFGGTYLDGHFREFSPAPGFDFAGRPLSRSPKWTLTAGYGHSFSLNNGGTVDFNIRTRISDRYAFLIIGTRNYYWQPGFSRTDITLGYTAPDSRWYLQGYLQNLENSIPATNILVGPRSSVQTQAPRTYGLRAGVKF